MTLRTVAIPDPAPGVDWSTVVPGQYLYDVTGITATLAAGTTGGHMFAVTYDVTTGEAAFYFDGAGFGTDTNPPAVGALVANYVLVGYDIAGTTIYDEIALYTSVLSPSDIADLYTAAGVSYPAWEALVQGLGPLAYWQFDPFPAPGAIMVDATGNGNDLTLQSNTGLFPMVPVPGLVAGNGAIQETGGYIADGTLTGFGTGSFTMVGWVDPVNVGPHGLLPIAIGDPMVGLFYFITSNDTPTDPLLTLQRLTQYPVVVYQQSDSLDGSFSGGTPGGRQVALNVTDGNRPLELIPTGFATVPGAGPYDYSWQPQLPASAQTPDGTLTTVAIPRLLLPAGYTVGARTFDLALTDQWTNITLWWDDAAMLAGNPINPYAYPPGFTYVLPHLKRAP